MRTDTHATALLFVAVSWLAAAAASAFALVLAVFGQGLGAVVGGCSWIGASLPLDRQVWALVNQPVLNFASEPGAGGYWLGSLVLPLLVGLLLLNQRPRSPTLLGQLVLIQTVWWAAVVAGGWLPLLDSSDGHLTRWLLLHRLPSNGVWIAPVAAAGLAVFVTSRLLEVERRRRPDTGRARRVATVVIHLVMPLAAWLSAIAAAGGRLAVLPVLGMVVPVITALIFSWFRYPRPYPRPLKSPSLPAVAVLAAAAVFAVAAIWWAGRPLPDGRVVGLLWDVPQSSNNIRPWIEPTSVFWWETKGEDR